MTLNLDQMDLTTLQDLQRGLDAAAKAGKIMAEAGFEPTFAVSEHLPLMTVPPIGSLAVKAPATVGAMHLSSRRADLVKDGPRERTTQSEPAAEVQPSPLDAVALPDAPPPASGQEEPEQKPLAAAPTLAAGDPAASPILGQNYTEADATWAVMTYVDQVEAGAKVHEAYAVIAAKLGRTSAAIRSRLYGAWAPLVAAEKARRAAATSGAQAP